MLPKELWKKGWITALTGSGIALLIVLLDMAGGREQEYLSLSGHERRIRGLSDDTWTRATRELVSHKLIELGNANDAKDLDWRRARTTYRVKYTQIDLGPGVSDTADDIDEQAAQVSRNFE